MVLSIVVDGNTLTHRVRLNDGTNNGIDGLTSAADGSGSMGGIIIDDPNHDLVLQGWQTVTVEESDCTTAPRLFTGFIGDRTTTHGNYPTDGGRQVNVTLWDQNSLLSWALITGSDGKRPEESRTARIDWLLGSSYLSTIVFDTGFVVPSGSSDFQEADYRGQYPRDVLDDVLGAFQVAFAFWDEAADKIGLFYDAMTATTRDSTLTISNDPADWTFADGVISGTCWPPYVDAELAQDPSEVYSLERLTYTNGLLLQEDPTTKAQFFPSPYPDRGQATDRSRIGKPTTAQDYMNALLAQASAEQETVTCTLLLPSTHVGLVDAGQRISVKFVHLDGYEDFVYTRITSRTTRQALGRSDLYEVQLTLNQRGPFGGGGGGGGSNPPPSGFPPPPPDSACVSEGGNLALGTTVTMDPGSQSTSNGVRGFNIFGTLTGLAQWDNGATSTSHSGACCSNWWGGGPTWWQYNDDLGSPQSLARIRVDDDQSPNANYVGTSHGGCEVWASDDGTTYHKVISVGEWTFVAAHSWDAVVPFADRTHRYWGFRFLEDFPGGGGGFWGGFTTFGWATYECLGGGATVPPSPGQVNTRPEVVTMTGPDGTTLWPFANGTLKVFVDDVEQTAKLVSQDGATGDFVLGFTPTPTEVVTVEYVGR
jgi:hypothetical protein